MWYLCVRLSVKRSMFGGASAPSGPATALLGRTWNANDEHPDVVQGVSIIRHITGMWLAPAACLVLSAKACRVLGDVPCPSEVSLVCTIYLPLDPQMHVRRALLRPPQIILDAQLFRPFCPRPPPHFNLFLSKNILLLLFLLGPLQFRKSSLSFP